jgi:hypothetical protein
MNISCHDCRKIGYCPVHPLLFIPVRPVCLEEELESRDIEIKQLREENESLKLQISKKESSISMLVNANERQADVFLEIRKENEKLKCENDHLKSAKQSESIYVNTTFHHALNEAKKLKEENEKLQAENESLEYRINGLRRSLSTCLEIKNKHRGEIEQLKAQLQQDKQIKCQACQDTKQINTLFINQTDPKNNGIHRMRCPDCVTAKIHMAHVRSCQKCNGLGSTKAPDTFAGEMPCKVCDGNGYFSINITNAI